MFLRVPMVILEMLVNAVPGESTERRYKYNKIH